MLDILANYSLRRAAPGFNAFCEMKSTLLIEQRELDDKIVGPGAGQVPAGEPSSDFVPTRALALPPGPPPCDSRGGWTGSGVSPAVTSHFNLFSSTHPKDYPSLNAI